MQTKLFRHFLILLGTAAVLTPPLPVCATTTSADSPSNGLTTAAPSPAPHHISRLFASQPAGKTEQWKTTFDMRSRPYHPGDTPDFLLQRAEYRGSGYSLMSEMGDLVIEEFPHTLRETTRRGGMLTFRSGNPDNTFRLRSFAATGIRPGEGMLAGASAELSLLKERALFKSIYIRGRESISPEGTMGNIREKTGSVLGLMTVLEPVRKYLVIEAEANYAVFDPGTGDDAASLRDAAYRMKARGSAGPYRYSAAFERTGSRYHVLNGDSPRDQEGVTLAVGADFQFHTIDVNLSRHNDNLDNEAFYPRLYRSEGNVDYTFKGITSLPMGVRYRRTLLESTGEPAGYGASASDADTFSGRMNYLTGNWDLGLKASYYQRTDTVLDQREMESTSIIFSPKITSGPIAVAPDISLRRSRFFKERQCADEYGIHMGIRGKGTVDYEVRGGYRKERTAPSSSGSDTIGASIRMGYPLDRFVKKVHKPSIRLKGEYNDTAYRSAERRNNFYSFLLTVDGASFF